MCMIYLLFTLTNCSEHQPTNLEMHSISKPHEFDNPPVDTTGKVSDLPKVLKPRVQVEVAHSRLRTTSMLVTCLPLDASPEQTSKKQLSCSGMCGTNPIFEMSDLRLHILGEILLLRIKLKGNLGVYVDLQKRIS